MIKPSQADNPRHYIEQIEEPRRSEIKKLHAFIQQSVPKLKPYIQDMTGTIMIGYGKQPYETKSGLKGEWLTIGLASQKNYISVYACVCTPEGQYVPEKYKDRLLKASIGKSCIRFKKLEDIDLNILKRLLKEAYICNLKNNS